MDEILQFESARRELELQLHDVRQRTKQVEAELGRCNRKLQDARQRDGAGGSQQHAIDEVAKCHSTIAALEREAKELSFEEGDLVGSIGVLREEEDKLMRDIRESGKSGGAGADRFRRQASEASSLLEAIAAVEVFEAPPPDTEPPPYSGWEMRQREKQKEAKEALSGLRRNLLQVVNDITYYADDKANWSSYINRLSEQYTQALLRCAATNLQKACECFYATQTELFSVTLKLSAGSRPVFIPLVNEVPSALRRVAEGVGLTVGGVDHVHCALNIPADIDPKHRKSLRDVVGGSEKVKEGQERLAIGAEKLTDRAVEMMCKLEDDFKDIWMGNTGGWKRADFQVATGRLSNGWPSLVRLGGVAIDISPLKSSLHDMISSSLESCGREGGEGHRTATDPDLDQSEDLLAVHYSPPRTDRYVHVNPLLENPPELLEARWRQREEELRAECRHQEQKIAAAAQRSPLAGVAAPDSKQQAAQEEADRARQERVAEERSKLQQQEQKVMDAERARRQVEEDMQRRKEEEEKVAREREQREEELGLLRAEEERLRKLKEEQRAKERAAEQEREAAEAERRRRWEEEELLRRRRQLASEVNSSRSATPDSVAAHGIHEAAEVVEMEDGSSLSEVYRHFCQELGIKPNSGVRRILPKEPGVHMTELNLGLNYIGVKGIAPLLEVLRRNKGLRVLNLRDNNLENAEVRSLVTVLLSAAGSNLTTLDLSNNPISLAGGSALVDLLTRQRRLTTLNMDGTLVQPKVLDRVEEQLKLNRSQAQQP
eukprot:Hpha_TRINITY_DN15587_c1_g5::TRINITY_DN15587_c1_g5_i1::g.108457::m.108457